MVEVEGLQLPHMVAVYRVLDEKKKANVLRKPGTLKILLVEHDEDSVEYTPISDFPENVVFVGMAEVPKAIFDWPISAIISKQSAIDAIRRHVAVHGNLEFIHTCYKPHTVDEA